MPKLRISHKARCFSFWYFLAASFSFSYYTHTMIHFDISFVGLILFSFIALRHWFQAAVYIFMPLPIFKRVLWGHATVSFMPPIWFSSLRATYLPPRPFMIFDITIAFLRYTASPLDALFASFFHFIYYSHTLPHVPPQPHCSRKCKNCFSLRLPASRDASYPISILEAMTDFTYDIIGVNASWFASAHFSLQHSSRSIANFLSAV